jgi:hypothetical protein
MERMEFSTYNVLATFEDMTAARKAILALERRGIESDSISLLGPAVEEAAGHDETGERDKGVATQVARGAATGGGIGTVAGGLLGLVAFAIPGAGPLLGTAVWAGVLGGALAGGAVGANAGGVLSLPTGDRWEVTFDSVREGRALVGVHSEDAADVIKGREILSELPEASEIRTFGPSGQQIEV